ncbi:hypothetical protein FOVG_18657 [Fusarium oxysporum f. sp. pisi HDV247]|uniref:Uncharacterized protein n=1 Tax=Fusarium oxysporum f. sp. pisi HDV247 TaxID=1080344 RepID=W9NQ11_FUSOX|nr:hypothetical protein FOVG_18657 [Fusarium oxysporum f. sp. pisi HDV247]
MPRIQNNCGAESLCADHLSNPFLLPPFEYLEPQLDLQVEYPSLISPLCGDNPNDFTMPSCIDPSWIHDLSQTVVLDRSASYHVLFATDQGQILSHNPSSPQISAFTSFDPDETIFSDFGCSRIDRPDKSVAPNDLISVPGVPVVRPKSHGERSLNSEDSFSSAAPHGSKRGSEMECQNIRLPKKAKFSHPNSGLDNSKLPYLKTFRGEDMKNRRKGAIVDKSSPPPHHVNRTVKGHDDKTDTSSPDLPIPNSEGDAAYAISQLPKGRGPVASRQVINIPNGPKNKI